MQPPKSERYTIKDYLSRQGDGRWELIYGVPYAMAPGAGTSHQLLAGEIFGELRNYLKGKPCRTFAAPYDVYFPGGEAGDTVVQPDVLVVCDPTKIKTRGIVGAPDVVVEVLSPSTVSRDFVEKLELYRREGVPEYWIVSPKERSLLQYTLNASQYAMTRYSQGSLKSSRLPEFTLDIDALFATLDGLPED
jgi:Uma2 family endonuclease